MRRSTRPVLTLLLLPLMCGVTSSQGPSFTFGAAGDFTLNDTFKKVSADVKSRNLAFFLALGDLSYKTKEREWCEQWTKVVQFPNVLLVSGNHDSGESPAGNINTYVKHCGVPFGIDPARYGKQYMFDFPADKPLARFIMVTPGLGGTFIGMDTTYDEGHEGFTFVSKSIDQARERKIPWVIVGMHKNYVSTLDDKINEVSKDAKRTFMTMLLNKRVDVILQGHEHGYERTHQLVTNAKTCPILPTDDFSPACVTDSDNAYKRNSGTVIHVIGTGGKDFRGLNKNDKEYPYFASVNNTTWGFGEFTVTETSLSFVFRRSAGEPLDDHFTIAE